MTEDEMVGWHHLFNGREFEQAPGDGRGQGGLACCFSWGRKGSDTTERGYPPGTRGSLNYAPQAPEARPQTRV